MTSAYASPPPFRFGPADLKLNARRFLERALVISALVHLTVVGVFRAAQERAGDVVDSRSYDHQVVVVPCPTPPPLLPNWKPPGSQPTDGEVFPVDNVLTLPPIDANPLVSPFTGIERNPSGRDGGTPDPTTRDPGPPPENPVVRVADTLPVPVDAPKPVYPDWAREAGIEGKVILRVLVGTDGIPKRVDVVSGPKGLTEAARDAVLRWTFRPGMVGKDPVEVWVEVPITFRLSGN